MPLIQLIYASRPFGFDSAMLNGILMDARRCNTRDNITGALICRADLYLQLLEGPEDSIEETYRRIKKDHRHLEIRLLRQSAVTERLFGDWAMLDDPARSWLWTHQEVVAGAIERASQAEIVAVFERVAREPRSEK